MMTTTTLTPARADWHQRALAVLGDDDLSRAVAWACVSFDVLCVGNLAADFQRHPLDALMMLNQLSEVNMLRFASAEIGDPLDVFVALSIHTEGKTLH